MSIILINIISCHVCLSDYLLATCFVKYSGVLFLFCIKLIFAIYVPFVACQECQLNQWRNKDVWMKEAAIDFQEWSERFGMIKKNHCMYLMFQIRSAKDVLLNSS